MFNNDCLIDQTEDRPNRWGNGSTFGFFVLWAAFVPRRCRRISYDPGALDLFSSVSTITYSQSSLVGRRKNSLSLIQNEFTRICNKFKYKAIGGRPSYTSRISNECARTVDGRIVSVLFRWVEVVPMMMMRYRSWGDEDEHQQTCDQYQQGAYR